MSVRFLSQFCLYEIDLLFGGEDFVISGNKVMKLTGWVTNAL